jgi:hypothetical protein
MWQANYRGQTAYLRDSRGLHDLAALLTHPRTDLSALHLVGGKVARGAPAERVLDRAALLAYRRRLAELDDDLAAAQDNSDLARQQHAHRRAGTATRRAAPGHPAGRHLPPARQHRYRTGAQRPSPARIRDAIRHITAGHPDLGAPPRPSRPHRHQLPIRSRPLNASAVASPPRGPTAPPSETGTTRTPA